MTGGKEELSGLRRIKSDARVANNEPTLSLFDSKRPLGGGRLALLPCVIHPSVSGWLQGAAAGESQESLGRAGCWVLRTGVPAGLLTMQKPSSRSIQI